MQQTMPWEEDWSQHPASGAAGGFTVTTPRDPRQVRREDEASARAAMEEQLRIQAAAREAARFSERNRPTLPAGYMLGADGKTAVRIPGLPPEKGTAKPGGGESREQQRDALIGVLNQINRAQTLVHGGWATGLTGQIAGKLPGTDRRDLEGALSTVGSSITQDTLRDLRAQSATGASGFGALSDREGEMLRNALAPLNIDQSDQALLDGLQRVRGQYVDRLQRLGYRVDTPSPEERRRGATNAAPHANKAPTISASGGPNSGGDASDPYGAGGAFGGPSPDAGGVLATGATRREHVPEAEAVVNAAIRAGWSVPQTNAELARRGFATVQPDQYAVYQRNVQWAKQHPGYAGSMSSATREVPTTAWNRFTASPLGTGIYAAADGALAGTTDEIAAALGGGTLADLNARKQAAFAANPKAALGGQALGTIGSMAGLGVASRSLGLASRFANPALAGDIAFGAASGAGQSNDNRLLGGTLGAVGGLGGNVLGNAVASGVGAAARTRLGTAVTNRARGVFGAPMLPTAESLSPGGRTLLDALNRAGPDNVTGQLAEAQTLGVPMSLADTHPALRELAAAAARRSPTASQVAEDALTARSRGQYDRFTSAVEQHLGPTTNIPQRSADLMTQARTAASDLYDRAYSNPVPSTPELDATLGTPFGRQALGRARTIAANERRDPAELGFALDAEGNVLLNPQPNRAIADHLGARAELDAAQEAYRAARSSPNGNAEQARGRVERAREGLRVAQQALNAAPDPTAAASVPAYTTQTLDYVKRGMDDVLEEQRNPITGRLVLDEAGRAQNQVRGQMLGEVDRLNPDFAAAREAYAGPMASRDALSRGGDSYGLHPDELGIQVSNQTPEHLEQMRLGYRGAMVDHAGRVRDNSNPWEATLGSPVARDRLTTVFPQSVGVSNMLRQLNLERTMAQTSNAVTGNSKTAGRQIMDKVFEGGGWPMALAEAGLGVITHGATLPLAARRLAGEGARDMYRLGVGARATAKSDEIAPILLGTNPVAAAASAQRLLAQQQALQALIEATRPKQLGMLGRAIGSQAAVAPLNR